MSHSTSAAFVERPAAVSNSRQRRNRLRALVFPFATALAFVNAAFAAPVTVPNGDFSAAANAGSIGGGAVGGSATNVPIGAGPWTGSFYGIAALLAPPTLTISAANQNATISGLVGVNLGGLLNNGAYFGQTLSAPVLPHTRYILSADIDVGRVLTVGLLDNPRAGLAMVANNVVLASTDTAPAGTLALQLLQNTAYRLSMTYVSPVAIAANAIEVRLFAMPQGLLTVDLFPTVTFDNVALDAVTLGVPATVGNITGDGQSATVNTVFPTPLGLRVLDGAGNGVPGTQVIFSAPASGASSIFSNNGSSGATLSVLTNASGDAIVTTTANSVAGAYDVSVQVTGLPAPQIFHLTNTAGAPASIVFGSGGSGTQSTTVNTPFAQPLKVRVDDSNGNPVASVNVVFSVPASGASAVLSSGTASTDASGEASVLATANTVAGSYAVTATVNGVAGTLSFSLTNSAGAPHDIVPIGGDGTVGGGATQSTPIDTAFPQPLKIRVRDEFLNPVSAIAMTYVAPTSGASAVLSTGSQSGSTVTVTSNAAGEGVVLATANAVVGAYGVTATVAGLATPVMYQLTNTPGNSSTPIGGGTQNTVVGTAFQCALIVRLADPDGQPREGIVVDFAAPASGASAELSSGGGPASTDVSVTTDADGVAYVDATANAVPGPYVVTATESGVANAAVVSFHLTNLDADDPIFENGFDLQCGGVAP